MRTIGLEISDVGILAAAGTPAELLPTDGNAFESPGIALAAGKKQVLYGAEAQQQARLMPRQVNDRFWSQLGTHPLPRLPGGATNHAEMAFAHLQAIRDRLGAADGWSVATPSFFDQNRLGILLGIAQELRVNIVSLCSLAVASMPPDEPNRVAFHIDLQQHDTEITRLTVGERVALDKTHAIPQQGYVSLVDALCRHVANEFVRATRYDPLHQAATEQQLFLRLIRLLQDGIAGMASTLEIETGRAAVSMTVLPQMLLDAAAGSRHAIVQAVRVLLEETPETKHGASLWLSHRAAWVPGLLDELRALPNVRVVSLAQGAAAIGALAMAEEAGGADESGTVPFLVSRLRGRTGAPPIPILEGNDEADDTTGISPIHMPPSDATARPTHLLVGHRAWPLGDQPLWLGADESGSSLVTDRESDVERRFGVLRRDGEGVKLYPEPDGALSLNGTPVQSPTSPKAGDSLSAAGIADRCQFIVVEA